MMSINFEKKETKDVVNLTDPNPKANPTTSDVEKKTDVDDLFVDQETGFVQLEKFYLLKARVSDYIDLFNKRFANQKAIDLQSLYENLYWERECAVDELYHTGRWTDDESLLSQLRQLPFHKQTVEYYKEYQLDYFEVKDIQDLRNAFNVSFIKILKPAEIQEQIKKDILQCAYERGDSWMIISVKSKLLGILQVFDKIGW